MTASTAPYTATDTYPAPGVDAQHADHQVDVEQVGVRIEKLLDRVAAADPAAARLAERLVTELVGLYGAGLGRIVDRVAAAAPEIVQELAADPVVGGLFALHDLHPVDLRDRIEAALDECRPYLGSHGGDVTLLSIDAGVAHLRLEGSCNGCGASELTLKNAVEAAILEAAPEIGDIRVDGAVPLGEGHAPPAGGPPPPRGEPVGAGRSLPVLQSGTG